MITDTVIVIDFENSFRKINRNFWKTKLLELTMCQLQLSKYSISIWHRTWSNFLTHLPHGQMTVISQTIFSHAFLANEKFCILIKISLSFLPKCPIDDNLALVQIMALRRIGDTRSVISEFFSSLKTVSYGIYHVYICEVSPHLSCVGTCQIWMWFKESNRYFCKIEIFAYGEINEWSFSNPTPWTVWLMAAKHIILYHPACCIVLHSVSLASISRTRLTGLAHNNEPSYAGLLDVQHVLISQAGVTRLA